MSRYHPLALPTRALLFQHLAAMEKAGMPAERAYALLDLGPDARGRVEHFRRLCGRGIDPATAGATSGLFTLFESRLVRAALCAGSPQPTYERLARNLADATAQRRMLRSRLMLPGVVLALALFVQPLPRLISGALSPAAYLGKALMPLIVLSILGLLAQRLVRWFTSGEAAAGRAALERLLLDLPLFGALHLRRNTRDFVESLALLLQAGMPLFDALPAAVDTVDNHLVRGDLSTLLPTVRQGAPLAHAVSKLRLVETTRLHALVHTGEASGTLADMLRRYADTESTALALEQKAVATWLPRVLYVLVALWMAFQILADPTAVQSSAALASPVAQWVR